MKFSYETPQPLFDTLNKEFNFDIDVCANSQNKKCDKYYNLLENGLEQPWKGNCWCNPPYDKTLDLWLQKAYISSMQGSTVVCLLNSKSTDTNRWHTYVMRASEIRYIKGRLQFEKGKGGCNHASIIVVFRPNCSGPPKISSIDTEGKPI